MAVSIARSMTPAGNAVGANLKANDNTGSAYMGYPAVACDSAGNFVVAWEDGRNPNETDIYAQRFDLNGARLGGNFRVNSDPPGSGPVFAFGRG